MITKFNSASKPDFVTQDILFDDGQTILHGFRVNVPKDGDIRLSDDDFIETDDEGNPIKVIKASDYSASVIFQNLVHEAIGKETVRDLFRTLKAQNLTQAEEGDIISRVYPILGCLADGFIRGARVICNSTATGGQFTQARKTYLLGKIDDAIAKL